MSAFNVIEVTLRRWYKLGYEMRHELVDVKEIGDGKGDPLPMVNCYTPNGDWIGSKRQAHVLFAKFGMRHVEKTAPDHCVCSIGFNPAKQKWYGWSHRAIVGFSIGDKIFEEVFGDDGTDFRRHGSETITTLAQAKEAAKRFAEYVS